MKTDAADTVSNFIARKAPKDVVSGLEVLAKLRMPVHDKRAFDAQLADMTAKADDDTKMTLERAGQSFVASDFPILSTENVLEKYWDKFDPFPIPLPGLIPPVELPAGPQQRPSPCDVYARTFGAAAADCACRAYIEARREGLNEYQAIIVGHFAGRRAQRTGLCPV
jgi:hypothetical protein